MKTSNLAVATVRSPKPSTRNSLTIASWNDVLEVVNETDRHGHPAVFIRLRLGDMAPRRYGSFPNLKKAQACHRAMATHMATHLEDALLDEINELGAIGADYGSCSSGLYNIEE